MLETERHLLEKAIGNPKSLYSIFDRVEVKKHEFKEQRRSELPKVVLTADGLATEFKRAADADLKGHLNSDFTLLEQNLHASAHAGTLPYLFQKYGWRIADPNDPEKTHPDEAFCDRYRTKQALAKPGTSGHYLLVKGDLTGIQEYIYNGIQPGKTGGLGNLAKRLRARSILVSLLTDFLANVILQELELDSWHLLFAGGGHFNLLMQDDKKDDLDKLSKSLSAAMRKQFGAHLELIVADEKCSPGELRDYASLCFEKVNAKRDRLKHRQHLGGLEALFGEEIKQDKKAREDREQRIGRAFPNRSHLLEVVSTSALKEVKGNLVLAEFESELAFCHTLLAMKSEQEAHQFLLKNKANESETENIQSALLLALNDTDFLPKEEWKSDFDFPVSFGFRFLGKNAPTKIGEDGEKEILDFSELAGKDKGNPKSDGFVRLGSLMLDVDNLGQIFSHGIIDASLAQIITLSREMNYFFTAHFDQRSKESLVEKNQIYVVYSGGDDAFAVGKWDMLMQFAKTLREDFQKFICYEENKNPDVHFSAGIFMSNPHYPVGRFYRDTKDLQEKAKKEDKNRVDVFDYILDWDSYIDKFELGSKFQEVLLKGQTTGGRKFNSSFAYRIMQLVKSSYYERDEWDNGAFHRRGHLRPDKFARNIALMHYLFARNGFSAEDGQKITDELEKRLMHSFLKNAMRPEESGGFEARDYLVALNFAILQVRSTSKNI